MIAFACGKMMERIFLQVVVRADMDLMGRKSHVERRMSVGRDGSVGCTLCGFSRVGFVLILSPCGKLRGTGAARVSVMGKLNVWIMSQ